MAFHHYLHAVYTQTQLLSQDGFDSAVSGYEATLDEAE